MKKSRLLVVALAATMCAGCSIQDLMFWKKNKTEEQVPAGTYTIQPEIKGGTLEEKKAIYETINNKPICNRNGTSSTEILPENEPTFSEDDGDGIKVTTKQIIGDYSVALSWEIDETQTYYGGRLHSDDAHDIIEIAYQGFGQPDGTFAWRLGMVSCGEAVCADAGVAYTAKIKNEEFKHDNETLADIYAIDHQELIVKDQNDVLKNKWPASYRLINYAYDQEATSYSPYWTTNNPQAEKNKQYFYVNVSGKVIYKAPDGNWALLADGNNFLELYAGSGTALNDKNFPNFANEYVKVSGNMSQYCGNMQLGFLTKVLSLKDNEKSAVAAPATYKTLTESFLASLKFEVEDGLYIDNQAVEWADGGCLYNSLAQVTGTVVANSLRDKNNEKVDPSKMSNGNRYTFDVQVGAQKITVAYDYHTDRNGTVGLYDKFAAKVAAGGQVTVKGTMRYSGNNSGAFISVNNKAVNSEDEVIPARWNIVPFLADHIA